MLYCVLNLRTWIHNNTFCFVFCKKKTNFASKMKINKQEKITFEKFEIERLGKNKINGGNTGDPNTTTRTSQDCSTKPDCDKNDPKRPDPFDPFRPDPDDIL